MKTLKEMMKENKEGRIRTWRVQMDIDEADIFVDAADEASVTDFCFMQLGQDPLDVTPAVKIPPNAKVYGYGMSAYEYTSKEA